MTFTHYNSASKGQVLIEDMHAAHIDQAVSKLRREGSHPALADYMEAVATHKHGEFLGTPEGQAWAAEEKNAEKHAALLKRLGWEG